MALHRHDENREISRDLSVLLNENVVRYQSLSVIPAVINMLLLYEIRLTQFQCCDRWWILDKGFLDATSHIAGRHLTPTLPAHSFSGWWHIFLVAAQLGRSSCCSRSPPLFTQFCNQDISGSQLEEKKDKRPTYCRGQLSFGLSCQICRAIAGRMQGSDNLWDSTRNHFSFNSFN